MKYRVLTSFLAKSIPSQYVKIISKETSLQNDEPLTCKNDNRGQIIYKEDEGNVEICHQEQWKKFATSN